MKIIKALTFTSTSLGLLGITLLYMGSGATQGQPSSLSGSGVTPVTGKKMNTHTLPRSLNNAVQSTSPAPARGIEAGVEAIKKQNAQRKTIAPMQGGAQTLDLGGSRGGPAPQAATLNRSFEAIPFTNSFPSDAIMATGPSDLLVAVNRTFRIYNKTGGQILDRTLASWFSNVLPSNQTDISVFDPWVIYDREAGRFILLALAKRNSDQFSRFLISVSDNNTAQGNWCNWSLDAKVNGSTNTNNWADYAKLGNNSNAIIISANMFSPFTSPSSFQYSKLRFLPKAALYNNNCPGISWWDHWDLRDADNGTAFTIQPSVSYFIGNNTNYLVNTTSSGSGSQITLWQAINNSNSNPQPNLTRKATINVNSYTAPPDAEQRGSTTRIDSGDARLLNAVWRGGGLWTTGSTGCSWSGDTATRSCLRTYKINPNTNTLLDQDTFGASGYYYYYPAITADPDNNAWVVFNRSSSTEYASIRHTARRGSESSWQGSAQLRGGEGCYIRLDSANPPRNRWGDYNGISWDPSSGNAWIFSQYAKGTSSTCGNNTWQTTVGELLRP